MKIALACALAIAAGCSNPSIQIDAGFTAEEQREIHAAIDSWPADLYSSEVQISRRPDLRTWKHDASRGFTHTLSSPLGDKAQIFLLPMADVGSPELYRRLVAHELGHTIGFDYHVDYRESVMTASISDPQARTAPTEEDVLEVRAGR